MQRNTRTELRDQHRPALPSGDYTIKIDQSIVTDGVEREAASVTQAFSVRGPRFSLSPQDVLAVYPPPGSLGDHSQTLPHVLLSRSTLPWERSPDHVERAPEAPEAPPWLALLLIREDEETFVRAGGASTPDPTRVQAGTVEHLKGAAAQKSFPAVLEAREAPDLASSDVYLKLESSDDAGDPIAFIDVDSKFLARVMPTRDQLRLLAHVRSVTHPGASAPDETAVVLCHRTPAPSKRNTVHLVSVEGWYTREGRFATPSGTFARLVCLKTWQFTCTAHPDRDFLGLVTSLTHGTLTLLDKPSATDVPFAMRIGAVPLRHARGDGTAGLAWYRGPLSPVAIDDAGTLTLSESAEGAAPALRDEALEMDDVSYPAAWELGRMLALDSGDAATALYHWKRARYREANLRPAARHLPLKPDRPQHAFPRQWFEDLARLRGVPFNYLVPDERMLPYGSIRFFVVDRCWVWSLISGAFSLGSGTAAEFAACAEQGAQALAGLPRKLSGCLLRSEVVSGWPLLEVDIGVPAGPDDEASMRARRDCMVRLSRDILLCLFDGVVECVDVHLPPEGLHFVFEGDALDLSASTTPSRLAGERTATVPAVRFKAARSS